MQVHHLILILAFLLLVSLGSCGAKVGGSVGGDCYECEGVDFPCNCPGYGGYYNPDALNLFRPGRFDDINSPVW